MAERTAPVRNGGPTNVGRPLPLRDQPGTGPHFEQPGQHPRPTPPRRP